MPRIACAHPGKLGDALYALQIARVLCEINGCTTDFYSSSYCRPLKNLFEFQKYVENFYVPDSYQIDNMGCGIQPYHVPIDHHLYERTFQLGFRNTPNTDLPSYIAQSIGTVWDGKIVYDFPEQATSEKYYVTAPRGRTDFLETFANFIRISPFTCKIIGGTQDYLPEFSGAEDCTGVDFLETLPIIANSQGFLGLMSSQLVLANGCDVPKVILHDGKSWDMRHVIYSGQHHYLKNPAAKEVLRIFR